MLPAHIRVRVCFSEAVTSLEILMIKTHPMGVFTLKHLKELYRFQKATTRERERAEREREREPPHI